MAFQFKSEDLERQRKEREKDETREEPLPSIETLLQELKHEQVSVRRQAVEKLQAIGDSRATQALLFALQDENSSVRMFAVIALGEIGDPHTFSHVFHALMDTDKRVGEKAASAIRKLIGPTLLKGYDPAALNTVLNGVQNSHSLVRQLSVECLGILKDKQVVPLIMAILERDPDINVRIAAAKALENLGDRRASEVLIQILREMARSVHRYDRMIKLQITNGICTHITIKYPQNQKWSKALEEGLRRHERDPQYVLPHHIVQFAQAVGEALYQVADKRVTEYLIKVLNVGCYIAKIYCAQTLGKIGDQRAIKALVKRLKDKRRPVREIATAALYAIQQRQQ